VDAHVGFGDGGLMSNRTEITKQTKQNLIDAFWGFYCENRVEKISVKDITTKAGYNRSTFYEYFKDVYDVLEQIEDSIIPTLDEIPPISIQDKMHGMPMESFIQLFHMNKKYYAILLGDQGDPRFASKLKNSLKPLILKEFTKRLQRSPMEMDYILEYTLSAMIGIMSYWFSQEDKLPNEQLLNLINKLMEQGVTKQLF
jgi:AcrR family transcriptional regulator